MFILVAHCFKNILRLEAGYPALRCHIVKQNTGHTHNTHNTGTTTPPNTRTKHTTEPLSSGRKNNLSDLKNTAGVWSCRNYYPRPKYFFCSRQTGKQLQSGVRSRRTSCPRSSSSRVNGTKLGAGSATCSRWRTSGARSSSSGSLTRRCTWHSASSRTCAKIRQRRQHQGQAPGA